MQFLVINLDASMPGGLSTYAQNLYGLDPKFKFNFYSVFGGKLITSRMKYTSLFDCTIVGYSFYAKILLYAYSFFYLTFHLAGKNTIFIGSTPAILSLGAIIINKLLKRRVIWTVHLPISSEQKVKQFFVKICAKLDVEFVVLNARAQLDYQEFSNNVTTIPNYSKYEVVQRENATITKLRCLTIGRFTHQKGYPENIDLLIRLSKLDNVESVTVIGEGPFFEIFKSKVDDLGVHKVHLVEAPVDVYPFYLSNDIFLLPSRFEGFPMVLLEALSLGLVPIAYDCETGPKEILASEDFLVPLMDADNFVRKVQVIDGKRFQLMQSQLTAIRAQYTKTGFESGWRSLLNAE
ncbi:glycosyltransferase [Roseovarius sp. SYSU LYC5161]|uniref:glycosyltransferase n=1 Tax=Roseovarius halophilus (ex Wu et al. 2025) TaxID=3376060 RepID=UPI00399B9637